MIPRSPSLHVVTPPDRDLIVPDGLPSPADWGLPATFTDWRTSQWDAVQRVVDTAKTRFIGLCCPTGLGKSLVAMAAGKISERRTVVLTSTLALADQYRKTFGDCGFSLDVRGMANYTCSEAAALGHDPDTSVAQAPCRMGYRCPKRTGGCDYFDIYRKAQRAPMVTSTYMAWMFDARKKEPLHQAPWAVTDDAPRWPIVSLLVCDEATEAADELERYVGIEISRYECLRAGVAWPGHLPIDGWIGWAKSVEKPMVGKINVIEVQIKASGGKFYSREYKLLKELHGKVLRLAGARPDEGWVMDESLDQEQEYRSRRKKQEPEDSADAGVAVRSARFVPLEPARYAERCLWRGVEKVVLMSATLRPKECERLGIKPEDLTFVEYPSSFPVERRPVYVVPSVMMNWRNEQDDEKMRWWLSRIDNIIEKRLERKGIIHAVSYARAAFIKANSKFGRYMMIHNSHDRAEKIALFKESEAPSILVSPSLGTGHDFSGDLARWVIIAKLPFASVQDKIVKARQDHDPEYQTFQVAQELVQFTGRAVRSEFDFAENFIVDDAFGNWFFRKARRFFPKWWLDSLQFCQTIPDPISLDRKISQE